MTAVTSLMKEQEEWDMERSRRSSKDNLHKRLVLFFIFNFILCCYWKLLLQ